VPARLRDLVRVLVEFGIRVDPPRGGGSHWKAIAANGSAFVLPANNGLRTELADVYIRELCRTMGIDYAELKKRL